jgi:hypothetical protein
VDFPDELGQMKRQGQNYESGNTHNRQKPDRGKNIISEQVERNAENQFKNGACYETE